MKQKVVNKKFKWVWVVAAFRRMGEFNGHLFAGVSCGFFLLLGLKFPALSSVAVAVAVLYVASLVWLVTLARKDEKARHFGFVKDWIASAPSDRVRADRQQLLRNQGMEGAVYAASLAAVQNSATAPLVNVDGTPMMPGGLTDINGNPYGVFGGGAGGLFNEQTGGFVAENNAYVAPMGLDSDPHNPMS
ncbi:MULTISPECIES: hypothetical protein [unclassified Variovorax]|uniref:hypothetical protein n=1 Tax=unclassified Variovorax TaxID=663243 RepID=UPI00076D9A9E|nr:MULTISPECIES: hypothetical protein [unclassified Variovorax]KWT86098.1 hypothetical protein APY03_3802 [Variovorax sp. WDL1]PNG50087.1 hypothetical protein CHC06_05710 [Variovorax sp. B2]PNG50959.1 hypothetical protein CHC07_05615 [Variovorax sp. B4]VTU41755.1 hypothetical protein SRS16P1_00123 [Variovorax sp. SRS16]VTU41794.1 hypothetical protein E5P1_00123 [Variovorax sp. PBL-E5]